MKLKILGPYYSENKVAFKKILKNHDLKWNGSWAHNNYRWKSDNNKVKADFIREDDITKEVIIDITGTDEFIKDIQEWAGSYEEENNKDNIEEINTHYKEKIKQEKAKGAPRGWIKQIEKEWDRKIKGE